MIIRYTIEYWSEIDKNNPKFESDITNTESSIGTAIDEIYDHYGRSNVIAMKFYECENIMCDEDIKEMLEVNNNECIF